MRNHGWFHVFSATKILVMWIWTMWPGNSVSSQRLVPIGYHSKITLFVGCVTGIVLIAGKMAEFGNTVFEILGLDGNTLLGAHRTGLIHGAGES